MGLKYAIWRHYKKSVHGGPRHAGVVDRPTIASKIFLSLKIGLSEAEYEIWRDSEKSASGGPRYPTVADRPPVPTDSTKSGSPWEPLLSPIVVVVWSHLRLGLVQIDIWAGQTDGQTDRRTDRRVPNIIKIFLKIPSYLH